MKYTKVVFSVVFLTLLLSCKRSQIEKGAFGAGVGPGLEPPTQLRVVNPSSQSGRNRRPTIRVEGGSIENGATVSLFRDSACRQSVQSAVTSASFVEITLETALGAGVSYAFYAKVTKGSLSSPCSTARAFYTALGSLTAPGINYSAPSSSPGSDPTPEFAITLNGGGSVAPDDTVTLYDAAACGGSVVATATQLSGATVYLTASAQADETTKTYSVRITDSNGTTFCSSAHPTVAFRSRSYNYASLGLQVHWRFNEGAADLAPGGTDFEDISGKGRHANLSGGVSLGVAGQYGLGARFDGSSGTASAATNTHVNTSVRSNFTMSLWVNPSSTISADVESTSGIENVDNRYAINATHGGQWDGGNGSHVGVGISVGTNRVTVFEHSLNLLYPILTSAVAINTWTHLLVTYTADRPRLYVNGNLVRTGLQSPRVTHPSLILGGGTFGSYYDGDLDDVRVWGYTLSAAEIAAVYNNTVNIFSAQNSVAPATANTLNLNHQLNLMVAGLAQFPRTSAGLGACEVTSFTAPVVNPSCFCDGKQCYLNFDTKDKTSSPGLVKYRVQDGSGQLRSSAEVQVPVK